MRDPDGRVRHVHVLPSGAGGAVRVDSEIFLIYLDFSVLLDLRGDEDRGKRRVAPRVSGKRRDTDQAVPPDFGRQITVRILAFDEESHRLEARLFTRLVVGNL